MHATRRVFLGAALIWLIQPGGLAAQDGLQGRVYEREADGSIGSTIASVEIEFTSEDGSVNETATSGADGSYRIALAPARYRVGATHPDYDPYSSGTGFFVVTGDGYQTANLFLTASGAVTARVGELDDGLLEYPNPKPTLKDRLKAPPPRHQVDGIANLPPLVEITKPADGTRFTSGEIRVTARGYGRDTEDGRLGRNSLAWESRFRDRSGNWTSWQDEGTGRNIAIFPSEGAYNPHGNDLRATYQIRLTGTDSDGASAKDMIEVTFQIFN